jgi:hypothetical protein
VVGIIRPHLIVGFSIRGLPRRIADRSQRYDKGVN